MKFTITSDPVDQYNGRGNPGCYDAEFAKLTPKNNCIVFDDFSEMEKVAQALDGWIKRAKLTGAKVKTTSRSRMAAQHARTRPALLSHLSQVPG